MSTTSWEEEFDNRFSKGHTDSFGIYHAGKEYEEIKYFISSLLSKEREEIDDNWKTAIGYICEPEEIERIFNAYKAIIK